MHYFCYSCQSQTDVYTWPQLSCGRCLSDFVEEIESGPAHGEREWSDEDATLTSIWNTVFRDNLIGNDPFNNVESEDEYHHAYNFGNDYTSENGQEEYAADTTGWVTEEEEEEVDYTLPEFDTHSEWDAANSTASDGESVDDSTSEYVTDDVSSNDDEDEYSSLNSYHYDAGDTDAYQNSSSDELDEGEGEDDHDHEEEEEEEEGEDIVALAEFLRQTRIGADGSEEELFRPTVLLYNDDEDFIYGGLSTEVPDSVMYNGLGLRNDHGDAGDYDYFYRNLGVEAAFVDAENWDTSPPTVGASESVIGALPRWRLRVGDAALHKDCSICLMAFSVNVELINLPCMHGFHSACIEQWLQLNASCPVCRCPCS